MGGTADQHNHLIRHKQYHHCAQACPILPSHMASTGLPSYRSILHRATCGMSSGACPSEPCKAHCHSAQPNSTSRIHSSNLTNQHMTYVRNHAHTWYICYPPNTLKAHVYTHIYPTQCTLACQATAVSCGKLGSLWLGSRKVGFHSNRLQTRGGLHRSPDNGIIITCSLALQR